MGCAIACSAMRRWVPGSPSGGPFWPSETSRPAGPASKSTRTPWRATPPCARKRKSCRSSSPRSEPPGLRAGATGCGSFVRLLVAGDSGAAGVGAETQDQALCGELVRCLSRHHTVEWCVLAANGLDSPGLLKLLQDTPRQRFDVVVLSMGANDATGLCAPLQWARWQTRLAELIDLRFAPALLVHSAVPPMHACLTLPQPLRWFMGHWAKQMNQSLARMLIGQVGRTMHWHPETTTTAGMAVDGIHPSSGRLRGLGRRPQPLHSGRQ